MRGGVSRINARPGCCEVARCGETNLRTVAASQPSPYLRSLLPSALRARRLRLLLGIDYFPPARPRAYAALRDSRRRIEWRAVRDRALLCHREIGHRKMWP